MLEELKEWLEEELASVEEYAQGNIDSAAGALNSAYWSGRRNSLINIKYFIELKETLGEN